MHLQYKYPSRACGAGAVCDGVGYMFSVGVRFIGVTDNTKNPVAATAIQPSPMHPISARFGCASRRREEGRKEFTTFPAMPG